MKTPSKEILERSKALNSERIKNDHLTAEPMFCLQIKVRDLWFDPTYSENEYWWNPETGEMAYDDEEGEPEDLSDWDGPFGYRDRWETVMVALTQKGIDEYMKENGHNVRKLAHRGEVRSYVDSFYRCPEMIAIRKYLMSLTK